MIWVLIALLALACCAVLYAAGRARSTAAAQPASVAAAEDDARTRFYRDQLKGLERDAASGRLGEAEAAAARAELAREFLRQNRESVAAADPKIAGRTVLVAIPLVAVLSFAGYAAIGNAGLPARPLDSRAAEAAAAQDTLLAAVSQVEARLAEDPDDVRGWQVLAPVYMQQQRFADAENAFRRILDLAPPTADAETDLAEARILGAGGTVDAESRALLESAVSRDEQHVRSRLYLAGALTRDGDYAGAVPIWTRLLDIAQGNEPWVAVAQSGLATAQAGVETGAVSPPPAQGGTAPEAVTDEMIAGMVEGLAERLYSEGGSGEEWARLVQARRVLGDDAAAQADFERGLAALTGSERAVLQAYGESTGMIQTEAVN